MGLEAAAGTSGEPSGLEFLLLVNHTTMRVAAEIIASSFGTERVA